MIVEIKSKHNFRIYKIRFDDGILEVWGEYCWSDKISKWKKTLDDGKIDLKLPPDIRAYLKTIINNQLFL